MAKANKDGWIRHRGRKQPVSGDTVVEVRTRDGEHETCKAGGFAWYATGYNQIMAYRIHKPAEQLEEKAVERIRTYRPEEALSLEQVKQSVDGPLAWRDRIREIDRTVEALEEERVSLIQRLEGEGFKLIDQVNAKIAEAAQAHEDMSDWRNWKVGDLIECVSCDCVWIKEEGIAVGDVRQVVDISYDAERLGVMVHEYWLNSTGFKFHSRPSA